MLRRRLAATTTVVAVIAALTGATASAAAASPVLVNDTLPSGAAVAFGDNTKGETNPGSTAVKQLGAVALPSGAGGTLKDAVSVAAGTGFVEWADHTGAVWGLGDNTYGQRGTGTTGTAPHRTPVRSTAFGGSGQPKALKLASYNLLVAALDSDGAVWQWGQTYTSTGTVVKPAPQKLTVPTPAGSRVIDIAVGDGFALALDDGGRVYSWGRNDSGQLGLSSTTATTSPTRITALPGTTGPAAISAGRDFGAYTTSTSGVAIWTWGRNNEHQLGNGASTTNTKVPAQLSLTLPAPAKVLALSSGQEHTLLLTNDGVIREWGDVELAIYSAPTVVPDAAGVLTGTHHPYDVEAAEGASFAVSTDGTIAAWGLDSTGQLGRGTTGTLTQPTIVTVPGTTTVRDGGTPATLASAAGATYVVVDAGVATSPQGGGYDFGSFSTSPGGTQTPPSTAISFTNTSTRPLTITSVSLDGTNPGDLTVGNNGCTGTLALDATCTVTVTFAPTGAGARSANVNLKTSNTRGGLTLQSTVPLTGTGYTPVAGLADFRLGLAPGQSASVSGPGNVIPLSSLDPALIPATVGTTSSAQVGKIPLGGLQVGKIPFPLPQVGKIQVGKIPLVPFQVGKIPLPLLQVGKIPAPTLRSIQVGKIPLLRQGGWTALLADYPNLRNTPISSLTLADLVDPAKNQPDPAVTTATPLERLVISDLDVHSSELARLSVLSILTAGLTLDQIPVQGGWCSVLPAVPHGGQCTDGNGLKRGLIELELGGVDSSLTGVGAVTVGALTRSSTSTGATALDDALVSQVLLVSNDPKYPGITLPGTHLGQVPLASIPSLSTVVDCAATDCTNLAGRTLADVVAAIRPTATIHDLGAALNPLTLGQLVEPFLDRASFDWESLDRVDIPLAAYPNRLLYRADVDVNCFKASGTTVAAKLPAGFQYVPGTATLTKTRGTGNVALADPTADAARGLVFSVPDSAYSTSGALACPNDSAHVQLGFGVLPSAVAGSAYQVSGDVRTASLAPLTAVQPGTITVTGLNNPPNDTVNGPAAGADQLVLGAITASGQAQYVPVDVPAGKTIEATVAITPLTSAATENSDLDATLYYPVGTLVDPALSGTAVQVPFGEAASVEPDALHPLTSTYGGALQDVPLLTDRPVAAVAATRGNVSEQLSAVAKAGTSSRHLLEIRGYNGGRGYFTARFRFVDPPNLGPCTTTPPVSGTPATSTYLNATSFTSGNTAVVVNTARLAGRFGATAANALLSKLDAFVHSGTGGVSGQVLRVDSDSAVRSAYAAWDAAPCDPAVADGVVRAVNGFVAANSPSTVTYVVLVGGDDLLPHARLEDHTRDGNEREEAAEIALNGNNPLSAAFASGYYLSDDPYGTRVPQAYLGQVVYLPQASTGRLGETPAEMTAQLDAFAATGGLADPEATSTRNAVVTDYDFLTRGGADVAAALPAAGYAVPAANHLSGPSWTESQLESTWLKKTPAPSVAVLNMHYDQYRALPSAGNTSGTTNDLYTSGAVQASSTDLTRRLIYTVGCHSGLDVPDTTAPGTAAVLDFAQVYAGKGATMVGNLGFGYADTEVIAYSAKVQSYLTAGLVKRYDVGTAVAEAKRLYVSRLAGLSGYDLKSAQQVVLWGLPQTHLSGTVAFPAPAPVTSAATTDPATGLTSLPLTVASSLHSDTASDGTHYYDVSGQTSAVPGRPILPAQYVDVPQVAGKQVRAVVPSALTSRPAALDDVTFTRPSVDHGQLSQPVGNGVYPATLAHVGTTTDPSAGNRSTLVVTPLSVAMTGASPTQARVTQFTGGTYTAYYGPAGSVTPPTITSVNGTYFPGGSGVTSYAVDVSHALNRTVKQVYVLAMRAPDATGLSTWVRTDLFNDTSTGDVRWAGGTSGQLGQFYVVAVDDLGDAAVSTQKGLGWIPQQLSSSYPTPVAVVLSPVTPPSGWYTGPVQVAPDAGAPAGTRVSIDGAAPVSSGSVTADGVHLVRVVLPDGTVEDGAQPVLVDSQKPVVVLPQLAQRYELHQPVPVNPVVRYGASGPAAEVRTGLAPDGTSLDTSTVGQGKQLSIAATSVAGLSNDPATTQQAFGIVYGQGPTKSHGFLNPVLNLPLTDPSSGLNLVLRNQYYEFAYHLADYAGSPVTSGAVTGNAFAFAPITCPSSGVNRIQLPKIVGPDTVSAQQGSASGDWHLDAQMTAASGCYAMTLTANDGFTTFSAAVQIS